MLNKYNEDKDALTIGMHSQAGARERDKGTYFADS